MRRPLKRLYEMMSVGRHASRHSGAAASRVSHLEFGIGEECFQGLGRCIAQCGNRNGSVLLALYGQRERRALNRSSTFLRTARKCLQTLRNDFFRSPTSTRTTTAEQ